MVSDLRQLGAAIGLTLFWVAAGFGWLGTVAGTCTMGDASQLIMAVPAVVIYVAALGCLWAARPSPWLMVLGLLPLVWPLWAQLALAVRLGIGVMAQGRSACDVLLGPPYEFDGDEGLYVALWGLLAATLVIGIPSVLLRLPRREK